MSTDVYIDISEGSTLRVGYLSIVYGYEHSFMDCLRILSGGYPMLDEHVVEVVAKSFDYMHTSLANLRTNYSAEYIYAMYQKDVPTELDLLTGDQVRAFLSQHQGKTWRVRVD